MCPSCAFAAVTCGLLVCEQHRAGALAYSVAYGGCDRIALPHHLGRGYLQQAGWQGHLCLLSARWKDGDPGCGRCAGCANPLAGPADLAPLCLPLLVCQLHPSHTTTSQQLRCSSLDLPAIRCEHGAAQACWLLECSEKRMAVEGVSYLALSMRLRVGQ